MSLTPTMIMIGRARTASTNWRPAALHVAAERRHNEFGTAGAPVAASYPIGDHLAIEPYASVAYLRIWDTLASTRLQRSAVPDRHSQSPVIDLAATILTRMAGSIWWCRPISELVQLDM